MKRKLLCIAVAVIMILPLAFAAIPMASAAGTLGSAWTEITGGPAQGAVSVEDDGSIKMSGTAGWSQAGILLDKYMVAVDGLELNLKVANATVPGQVSAAAIVYLSSVAIDDEFTPLNDNDANHNVFAGNSYSVMCNTSKTAAYVIAPQDGTVAKIHGGMYSLLVSELGLGWNNASLATVNYAEFTIRFAIEGDKVELYVNGTKVEGYGLNKANIINEDGYAYLAVSSNGYGGAIQDVTLTTINGTAANEFVSDYAAPVPTWNFSSTVTHPNIAPYVADVFETTANNTYLAKVNADLAEWGGAVATANVGSVANGLSFKFKATTPSIAGAGATAIATVIIAPKDTAITAWGTCGGQYSYVTASNVPGLALSLIDNGNGTLQFVGWTPNGGGYCGQVTIAKPADDIYAVEIYNNGTEMTLAINGVDVNGEMAWGSAGYFDVVDAQISFTQILHSGSTSDFEIIEINDLEAAIFGNTNKPFVSGAQYRTEGVAGLRFLTKINLNEKNSNENVVKMGTLIMPADKLGDADLVITDDGKINDVSYLDIVAKNYYTKSANTLSFTAVLIDIPEGNENRDFVAVSYIEYADGTVVYGDACVRNIAELMA